VGKTAVNNTAHNSSDNLPSYIPGNHDSSETAYIPVVQSSAMLIFTYVHKSILSNTCIWYKIHPKSVEKRCYSNCFNYFDYCNNL